MPSDFDERLKEQPINLSVAPETVGLTGDASQNERVDSFDNQTAENRSVAFDSAGDLSKSVKEQSCSALTTGVVSGDKNSGANEVRSLAKKVPLKRHRLKLPFVAWFFLIPLLASILCLVLDPTAPYVFQKLFFSSSYDSKAAALLTQAINIRRDPELLQNRAAIYSNLHRYAEQEKDLQELYDRGFRKDITAYTLAEARANSGVFDERTMNLLRKHVEDGTAHRTRPAKKFVFFDLESSIYALTLLGDKHAAYKLDPADVYNEAELDLSRGLLKREIDDSKNARTFFERSKTASEELNDKDGADKARCFLALLKLDSKEPQAAQLLVPIDKDAAEYKWIEPFDQLVQSWSAFESGDTNKSLALLNALLNSESDSFLDFHESGIFASAHYLRAIIYSQSGLSALSAKELAAYKHSAVLGKVFIPIPYRNSQKI